MSPVIVALVIVAIVILIAIWYSQRSPTTDPVAEAFTHARNKIDRAYAYSGFIDHTLFNCGGTNCTAAARPQLVNIAARNGIIRRRIDGLNDALVTVVSLPSPLERVLVISGALDDIHVLQQQLDAQRLVAVADPPANTPGTPDTNDSKESLASRPHSSTCTAGPPTVTL